MMCLPDESNMKFAPDLEPAAAPHVEDSEQCRPDHDHGQEHVARTALRARRFHIPSVVVVVAGSAGGIGGV